MNIFVSYTVRDGLVSRRLLKEVAAHVARTASPYIDLLDNCSDDPQEALINALGKADGILIVLTPSLWASPWVRFEVHTGHRLGVPFASFDPYCRRQTLESSLRQLRQAVWGPASNTRSPPGSLVKRLERSR
jgi:hypothetical protein